MTNSGSGSGFNMLPVVVKNLLIINGLFFLATNAFEGSLGIDLRDILGLHFWESEAFSPYQFITYMFMHGDTWHILFNMFALWMFGTVLENHWGAKRFLIYYFVTGIGAGLLHYLIVYWQIYPDLQAMNAIANTPTADGVLNFYEEHLARNQHFIINDEALRARFSDFTGNISELMTNNGNKDALLGAANFIGDYKREYLSMPNVVGASGSVYGLLLAYGMLFPNNLIYLYFLFPIKAKYFVILFGALELYLGIAGGGNVAHFAHLGGMVFGFFLIKYWKARERRF